MTVTVGGVVSGNLRLPVNLRLGRISIERKHWKVMGHYQIIAFMIPAGVKSRHESHGLTNPFPPFTWCAFSATSSGTAPKAVGGVMVQAYNAAAVIPPDITRVCVGEVF